MELIREVLKSYGIYPHDIQPITNSLYYVKDYQSEYAVKRSKLTSETLRNWEYVYHQAYQNNFTDILPVYLTNQQKLYEPKGDYFYYVMPWINETREIPQLGAAFRSIGHIHAKTKRTQSIKGPSIKKQFQSYQTTCESIEKKLLYYVEQFEQKRYMSPFELLVCTQYRDLVQVNRILKQRLGQFVETLDEKEEWKYSLCHGRLHPSHILSSNQTMIINWEYASLNNPIIDLYYFMNQYAQHYDREAKPLLDKFDIYTDENSLDEDELFLLIIYLLDLKPYFDLVEQYEQGATKKSMVHQTQQLQQVHRQLMFGLQFSAYVEEKYEMIDLEDLES
ncbi:phosphotransferase [Ornithinibacillus halophilus]|uniref:Spore coat protein YsxE n=1 Tax=Ornithinibacillus halophilus TaxID=930117 RepID=A0A1M5DD63_9BACI|nr:phosphotransferase [Ornithinibacillus halophilus]SHF64993.1 spore coat protein YsxE [Ornithinibacillus halophilus]